MQNLVDGTARDFGRINYGVHAAGASIPLQESAVWVGSMKLSSRLAFLP